MAIPFNCGRYDGWLVSKGGDRPRSRYVGHLDNSPGGRPVGHPDGRPGGCPGGRPDGHPEGRPAGRLYGHPDGRPLKDHAREVHHSPGQKTFLL